jgi:hypothetical protein
LAAVPSQDEDSQMIQRLLQGMTNGVGRDKITNKLSTAGASEMPHKFGVMSSTEKSSTAPAPPCSNTIPEMPAAPMSPPWVTAAVASLKASIFSELQETLVNPIMARLDMLEGRVQRLEGSLSQCSESTTDAI